MTTIGHFEHFVQDTKNKMLQQVNYNKEYL